MSIDTQNQTSDRPDRRVDRQAPGAEPGAPAGSGQGVPELVLQAPGGADPVVSATPVVLAPMAGVTNAAYRQLCREQAEAGGDPQAGRKGLFVCEMITSRGLVERDRKSLQMLAFDPGETLHSVQLYGVDAEVMGEATRILCGEFGVAHVDLNFGCPVPKVTRKGGGGVLPWKRDRLRAILQATVAAAEPYGVPVTMKTRKGIDDAHLTYLDAGRIAAESGCAAIALHGRTVAQAYSGTADWDAITELRESTSIPVLGNGDIWEAETALAMMRHTGVAGVVVGRGCLGRPWLFRDLADAFAGRTPAPRPRLGEVAATMRRHAELLSELMGEQRGVTDLRKHVAWYFKGYPVGGEVRRGLGLASCLAEVDAQLEQLDPEALPPDSEIGTPRGRQGSPREKIVMPEGWLDDSCGLELDLSQAETDSSGG